MPLNNKSILIADDHPMFRKGLMASLQSAGFNGIFFEAENGEQALHTSNSNHIDLHVFDYKMPDITGVELTRKILRRRPASRIMIMSSYAQPELIMQFYRAGVKGYLEKNAEVKEIKEALTTIANGKIFYHPALRTLETGGKNNDLVEFSSSESDLLKMLANGLNSEEIAKLKQLSVRSVETYRSRLIKKAKVKNTAELLDYCYRNGLI